MIEETFEIEDIVTTRLSHEYWVVWGVIHDQRRIFLKPINEQDQKEREFSFEEVTARWQLQWQRA